MICNHCTVVATLQAAAPLVAKPLIGFTYRATVATFPGAFLLLVSSVALPCACALFAVTWGLKGRYCFCTARLAI